MPAVALTAVPVHQLRRVMQALPAARVAARSRSTSTAAHLSPPPPPAAVTGGGARPTSGPFLGLLGGPRAPVAVAAARRPVASPMSLPTEPSRLARRRGIYGGPTKPMAGGAAAAPAGSTAEKLAVLRRKYEQASALSMVTAYDASSAALTSAADVDMLLVGDSLGMVMLGQADTTQVTPQDIATATGAVIRSMRPGGRQLVVSDFPLGADRSLEEAQATAALFRAAGADAVKIEGASAHTLDIVRALVREGTPVMGHIGLTPQTMADMKVQGRDADAALRLLREAQALEEAGVFALVLECVPQQLGAHITHALAVPTIGIGAGPACSGQVLVYHDLVGLFDRFMPKFCKRYANVASDIQQALEAFRRDVTAGAFPAPEHCYNIRRAELQQYLQAVTSQQLAKPMAPREEAYWLASALPPPKKADAGGGAAGAGDRSVGKIATAALKPARPLRKVVVVGSGALGTLIGGSLASLTQAGRDLEVWLISSRPALVRDFRTNGLQIFDDIDSDAGCRRASRIPIQAATPAELDQVLASGPADLALVLCKSNATEQAAQVAKAVLHPEHGVAVTLQNGIGNVEALQAALGSDRVIAGTTAQAALVPADGNSVSVSHTGAGATVLAAAEGAGLDLMVQSVAELFTQAGMATTTASSPGALQDVLWSKLLCSATILPLTALLGCRNGQLLSNPPAKALLCGLVEEATAVARALGVVLPADPVEHVLGVARVTANNESSMLRDVQRRVPTEIDAITGQIVEHGRRLGLPVGLHEAMLHMIKSRQALDRLGAGPSQQHVHHHQQQEPVRAGTAAIFPATGAATEAHMHVMQAGSGLEPFGPSGMLVAESVPALRQARRAFTPGERVGFVPTMGALHEGHMSLVREARRHCDRVVASIFVNPTQFGPNEDLAAYPRSLFRDLEMLEAEGVDLVFVPGVEDMYPPTAAGAMNTHLSVPGAANRGEARDRTSHFDGVVTVCTKLFNLVRPDIAFFGQKDAQQCAVIRQLVADLCIPMDVAVVPTARAPDGLALSSRNVRLTEEERAVAPVLYRALDAAVAAWRQGEHSVEVLRKAALDVLATEPRVTPHYVLVTDALTMEELDVADPQAAATRGICISTAAQLGSVRLLDAMLLPAAADSASRSTTAQPTGPLQTAAETTADREAPFYGPSPVLSCF